MAERVEVDIKEANLATTIAGDTWGKGSGGVHITNMTGAEEEKPTLPAPYDLTLFTCTYGGQSRVIVR